MVSLAPGTVMWSFPLGRGRRKLRKACVGRESFLPSTAPATAAAHREWLRVSHWAREKLPLRSLGSTEFGWLWQVCLFSSSLWPPCPAAESLVLKKKKKENPAATSLCISCCPCHFTPRASPCLSPFLKLMVHSLSFIFKHNNSFNHLLLLLNTLAVSQQSLFTHLFGVNRMLMMAYPLWCNKYLLLIQHCKNKKVPLFSHHLPPSP